MSHEILWFFSNYLPIFRKNSNHQMVIGCSKIFTAEKMEIRSSWFGIFVFNHVKQLPLNLQTYEKTWKNNEKLDSLAEYIFGMIHVSSDIYQDQRITTLRHVVIPENPNGTFCIGTILQYIKNGFFSHISVRNILIFCHPEM